MVTRGPTGDVHCVANSSLETTGHTCWGGGEREGKKGRREGKGGMEGERGGKREGGGRRREGEREGGKEDTHRVKKNTAESQKSDLI